MNNNAVRLNLVPVQDIPKETKSARELAPADIFKLKFEMAYLCAKHNGAGLAAVQCGLPYKLFIDHSGRCFVDCEYKPLDDKKFTSLEGCLSLPNQKFAVQRYENISVQGYELILVQSESKDIVPTIVEFSKEIRLNDDKSNILELTLFQHEIDHQNNCLISDIGIEMDVSIA